MIKLYYVLKFIVVGGKIMCVLQAEIFFVSPQESAALAGSGGNIFFQADKAILSALKSQITISFNTQNAKFSVTTEPIFKFYVSNSRVQYVDLPNFLKIPFLSYG